VKKLSAHILVVDDEPDVETLFRQQFRRDLRSGRFIMEFARSGADAIERAKALAENSLSLILSDINMPGMSGLEMLPKVKAARPNGSISMITAYGDETTKKKAVELGAAGLLTKPVDFGSLRHEIDQRLTA
jgi:CheY-like chemotaxis protein